MCPQMAAAPGYEYHLPVHDPGHTCPPAMCVPPGPRPAVSRATAQACLLQDAFLEPACREVITPHRHRLRGGRDKQQRLAIRDLPWHTRCPQTCCHHWVTGAGAASPTLPPAWPGPGGRWHRVQPVLGKRTLGLGGCKRLTSPVCDPEVSWGGCSALQTVALAPQHLEQRQRKSVPKSPPSLWDCPHCGWWLLCTHRTQGQPCSGALHPAGQRWPECPPGCHCGAGVGTPGARAILPAVLLRGSVSGCR